MNSCTEVQRTPSFHHAMENRGTEERIGRPIRPSTGGPSFTALRVAGARGCLRLDQLDRLADATPPGWLSRGDGRPTRRPSSRCHRRGCSPSAPPQSDRCGFHKWRFSPWSPGGLATGLQSTPSRTRAGYADDENSIHRPAIRTGPDCPHLTSRYVFQYSEATFRCMQLRCTCCQAPPLSALDKANRS